MFKKYFGLLLCSNLIIFYTITSHTQPGKYFKVMKMLRNAKLKCKNMIIKFYLYLCKWNLRRKANKQFSICREGISERTPGWLISFYFHMRSYSRRSRSISRFVWHSQFLDFLWRDLAERLIKLESKFCIIVFIEKGNYLLLYS